MKWRVNCFCFVVRVYLCSFYFLFLNSSYVYVSSSTLSQHPPTSGLSMEGSRVSKRNVSFGVKEHLLLYLVLWFVFTMCCTHAPCNSFAFPPVSPFLIIFEGGAFDTFCLHSSSASVKVGSVTNCMVIRTVMKDGQSCLLEYVAIPLTLDIA